jgi:hypothetical protein
LGNSEIIQAGAPEWPLLGIPDIQQINDLVAAFGQERTLTAVSAAI